MLNVASLAFLKYLRGIYKLNLNDPNNKVHYAIIQSIYDTFLMASDDINTARLEMCLKTAHGYWLDHWGSFFSVYRKSGEEDTDYAQRIIDSVIQPKSTIPAIKDGIVDYLNSKYNKNYTREDIIVKEPWKDIAKYSHKGRLSRDARFFSQDYYTHAVLDINIPEEVTDDIVDLVKSIKAAGVKVMWSILNSYDIISGFNDANDAWAAYSRWLQTQANRNQYAGFVLSSPSGNLSGRFLTEDRKTRNGISGSQQIWWLTTSLYQWYAKIYEKNTDDSILITKKDLIGLLDFYEVIEHELEIDENSGFKNSISDLSGDKDLSGAKTKVNSITKIIKIGDDILKSIELMDDYLTLSYEGRTSTSKGTLFELTATHELYQHFQQLINEFKNNNRDYYNALQPPILNGERAMYLVARNKNWIWNTPTMTHQDFFDLWEPFEGEEHTLQSIEDFEDAYYNGYITFGDKYQPPIVMTKDPWYWTPKKDVPWLWGSATLTNEELEEIYMYKFGKFPELTETKTVIETDLSKAFRLSDNGVISNIDFYVEKEYTKHPDKEFKLSDSGVVSNIQFNMVKEEITHPELGFTLSGSGVLSNYQRYMEEVVQTDSSKNFRTSVDGELSTDKMISGKQNKVLQFIRLNEDWKPDTYMSGQETEITHTRVDIENRKPDTYMSGDLTEVKDKIVRIDGKPADSYISGFKSLITQNIIVHEGVPTLGRLIELEENQEDNILYSIREELQSPVQIVSS